MNFSRIKNLIKKNGDKFILVENDTPEIVMMSFGEYEKLTVGHPELSEAPLPQLVVAHGEGSPPLQQRAPVAESLESDRPEETEFVIPLGPAEPRRIKPVRLEDISLDDLPL